MSLTGTRSKAGFLGLLICAALLFVPRLGSADDEEWVEVTGEAAIVEDNEVHAREMALQQALRQAVEMVAGTIVSGISESSQFISVRDEITSQASGYVRRYEIKSTDCEEGTCKVSVRALVAKQRLSERLSDLGLLLQRRGYPRVIMLIQEQNVGDERPSAWWFTTAVRSQVVENTLVSYLNKILNEADEACKAAPRRSECWTPLEPGMRFRFMDYRSVSATPMVQEAKAGVDLTDEQARQLAGLTDAEVAIVGRAVAVDQGTPWGVEALRSIRADVNLRIIDVASGNVLGTVGLNRVQNFPNATMGGESLMERLARELSPRIQRVVAESWGAEETGVRTISLEVDGLGSFEDLQRFRSLLSSAVTGVRTVTVNSMSGSKASLQVQATIGAEQLAAELSTRPIGNFTVRVTSMDSASVGIRLGN